MSFISFGNKHIKLEFDLNNEGTLRLTYFGNANNFINKASTFVEIETSETNHLGSHCSKQCNTPYGKLAKYVRHSVNDNELIVVSEDEYLQVETHFVIYENTCGLSIYNIVKNISNNDIHLEYVSSFYLHGLGQDSNPTYWDMNVLYASNSWHTEAQWKEESFIDANIFNANDKLTMKKFVLNNTGSWSTKEYLPMIGVRNIRKNQMLLAQVENNGSWHIELGDNANTYYLSISGPEMVDNQWCLSLKPDETFISIPASIVLSNDFEGSVQEITKLRRHLINKNHIDYKTQPVIYNDFMHCTWDRSSEELLRPLIDVSSEVGVDTFVVDAGWFFEKSGWTNYIGEYKEYSTNFPSGGLRGLFDYMRSKGLKTGLWFEIENIGMLCPELKDMPEEFFMHINGKRILRNSRYCLNLCNKDAFLWAYSKINDAVDKYSLDYIKIDYNLDLGPGNDDEDKFLGVGLLLQNRKVVELVKKLQASHPNLTIENCASGGQRLDYGLLKDTQLVSTSDLENYYFYPYISGSIATACLPEQAGIWSYPVCNDTKKIEITDEIVIFNMTNALLGRLTLASDLNKLTPYQLELVKEGVNLTKELNEFRKVALPIFPNGITRFFKPNVVHGLMDEQKIVLTIFNMLNEEQIIEIDLNKYNVKDINLLYPKNMNVPYSLTNGILKVTLKGLSARAFVLQK